MHQCPYCGSAQPDTAHFCGQCGRITARQADAPATTLRRTHLFDADLLDKENIPTIPMSSSYQEISSRTQPTQVPVQHIPSTPFPEQEEDGENINFYNAHYQAPFYNDSTMAYDVPQSEQSAYQPPMSPRHLQKPSHKARPHQPGCLVALMVATCLLLVSTSISSFFLFVLTPTLKINGSSTVTAGSTLALYGSQFWPASTVTFTVDAGQRVFFPTQVSFPAQQTAATPQTASLTVDVSGNFATTLAVDAAWSPGRHILHATETTAVTTREATLPFTVNASTAQPAQLSVSPTSLSFGALGQGKKATLAVTLNNTGGQAAHWSIDTGTARWLSVDTSSGTLAPGAPQQVIHVTCDSSTLALGPDSAMLQITSDGGNSAVSVTVQIVTFTPTTQAQLSVSPQTLAFQPMATGQKASLPVTIANTGTLPLTWQAAIGNASWATLDTLSGTLQPGDSPLTVHVNVDTTSLSPGDYSAVLAVSSTGGSAQVTITLTVTAATPAPSPQLTLTVTPSSFASTACTSNAQQGWTCNATVSNQGVSNLTWSASSSGSSSASFSPASGTLAPGNSAQVTIQVPATTICPSKVIFVFSGSGNTVSVPWSCGTPTLTVSPSALNMTDCTSSANGWQCKVTLSDDIGGLNWSASSNLNATFSASSGTVYVGTPATVIVLIATCTPGAVSFTGPGNTVTLPWACSG